eukprot:5886753-Heterocapsa_arctica.AAC.1
MAPAKWKCLHAGKLNRVEHITRNDARGLLWAVRHALRSLKCMNRRILRLDDNMSLCLAVGKGRSGSNKLRAPL